jgi:hypothetical protein
MFVASLTVSTASQATLIWSPCQTIVGVVHEPIGSNGNLLLTLSPGITGCSAAGITGAVQFMIGQDGVTLDYLGGFLASSLSANATGKTVQITMTTARPTAMRQRSPLAEPTGNAREYFRL